VSLGILRGLALKMVNELLVMSQPAHIQALEKHELKEDERDVARANYIRQRLGEASTG